MERPDYIDLFSTPQDYKPPDNKDLPEDTQYPNLNSLDYYLRSGNDTPKIQSFYETLIINEENLPILCCNDLRGRIWNGHAWGFENIDSVGDENKKTFRTQCDAPITNCRFISNTIFILTQANGSVKLWSTRSEVRNSKGFCLFMIGHRQEHIGIVLSLDIFPKDNYKVVTGSSDGVLKIWDTGTADLQSIHTMRFAHADNITGISCSKRKESVFVTCSRDKNALIWDYRKPRPASALLENHKFAFSTVYWSRSDEKDENVLLGDETGTVHSVDTRMPNKILDSLTIFNRPIRKLSFYSNQMAVIGYSNCVKVFTCEKPNDYKIIYKDSGSKDILRDVIWSKWSESEFYTVGWGSHFHKHTIK